ncbi:MAG: hypothetical protein AAGA62_07390 [Bacteroidota bacterium]
MSFEQRLTGGHPNSLGNTIEVVEEVLADHTKLAELFNCYWSKDEVVRLRVSNALKRVAKAEKGWLIPYLDRLIEEVSLIDQASTKWTLSQLFLLYTKELSAAQRKEATTIMRRNLETSEDWIVLSQTMVTLGEWTKTDDKIRKWLLPMLEDRTTDERKSVRGRANKIVAALAR